jgi:hypothetical protein
MATRPSFPAVVHLTSAVNFHQYADCGLHVFGGIFTSTRKFVTCKRCLRVIEVQRKAERKAG